MECVNGKYTSSIGSGTLATRLVGYGDVTVDIGTGDGRYVVHVAKTQPTHFVIGIDACREHVRSTSRCAPPNTLFVVANALALPDELTNRATVITINFPWGSLLKGLLTGESALLDGLWRIARPAASLQVRLNASAFHEACMTLTEGACIVRQSLQQRGFVVGQSHPMDAAALRAFPTSWAKRLGFGRDPHAIYLRVHTPQACGCHGAAREAGASVVTPLL